VFENRELRRKFGPKRDEVVGRWRKLHNNDPHNLFSPESITRIIKSRSMRWMRHVERMEDEEGRIYVIGKKAREAETAKKTKT
jgi:hypothetical protein